MTDMLGDLTSEAASTVRANDRDNSTHSSSCKTQLCCSPTQCLLHKFMLHKEKML